MKVSILFLLCTILFTLQSSALLFSKSSFLPTTSTNENRIDITIKQATPLYNKISNSIQQYIIPIFSFSSSSSTLHTSTTNTADNILFITKRQQQQQQQQQNNNMIPLNSSSTAEGIQHNGPVAALAMVVLFCILTF
ncbi:unnamed protein product [Cunninghamella blakesleeana]